MSSFKEIAERLCEKDKLLLGEWAFNTLNPSPIYIAKKFIPKKKFHYVEGTRVYFENPFDYLSYHYKTNFHYYAVIWEMAVSCLGEREVKKRLEALK